MRAFCLSMAYVGLASFLTVSPVPAQASEGDLWQGFAGITLAPTPGREVGGEASGGDQNQSSYALQLRVTRKAVPLAGQVSGEVEVNYRPDYLLRGPQSRLRLRTVLGNGVHYPGLAPDAGKADRARADTLRPRVEVRYDKVWSVCRGSATADGPDDGCPRHPSGFFQGKVRKDTTLEAGLVYSTHLTSAEPDVELRVAGSVNRLWSTSRERDRWTPRTQVSALVGPLGPGIRPFVQASYDLRLYDGAWSGMDRARLDRNLQIGAGADLEKWVGHGIDALQIGVLYYRRRSNRANASYERGFFTPRVSISRRF